MSDQPVEVPNQPDHPYDGCLTCVAWRKHPDSDSRPWPGEPDGLTQYYRSLYPAAGDLAVEEMVRLRRDHDRTCENYFTMYCAAMGFDPSQFGGAQSSDPTQDVADEREKLLDEMRHLATSRDGWFSQHQQAKVQLDQAVAARQHAEAAAIQFKAKYRRLAEQLRSVLDHDGSPAPLLRGFAVFVDAGQHKPEVLDYWVNGFLEQHPHLPAKVQDEEVEEQLESAWGIIANSGGFDHPENASPGWADTARRWLQWWHKRLSDRYGNVPEVTSQPDVAAPTGGERPDEHWNARQIRERSEATGG